MSSQTEVQKLDQTEVKVGLSVLDYSTETKAKMNGNVPKMGKGQNIGNQSAIDRVIERLTAAAALKSSKTDADRQNLQFFPYTNAGKCDKKIYPTPNGTVMTSPVESQLPKVKLPIDPTVNQSDVIQQSIAEQKNANPTRFECPQCGKTYAQRQTLQSHSYTHGNVTFPCDKCEKIYKQPRSLRNHKLIAHSNKRQPVLRCLVCGKDFQHRSALQWHSFSHLNTTFPCEICGKIDSHPNCLCTHVKPIKTIEDILPYKCPDCSKHFEFNSDLRKHSQVHLKEFHSCEECGVKFKVKCELEEHRKMSHSSFPHCHMSQSIGSQPTPTCSQSEAKISIWPKSDDFQVSD